MSRCSPEKNRTHDLKPEAQLNLSDISAVTEGIKTDLFKASIKKREGGGHSMSLMNALKKDSSQVASPPANSSFCSVARRRRGVARSPGN